VMVHQAAYAYLRACLSIEYDRGFVVSQVNNAIEDRLRTYFTGLPFGAWVEISDVTLCVHQVLGVDNVYLTLASEDAVDYGIKVYDDSSDDVPASTEAGDFKLDDNMLPIFMESILLRKPNR